MVDIAPAAFGHSDVSAVTGIAQEQEEPSVEEPPETRATPIYPLLNGWMFAFP
jgi:hypothetical protein